MKVIANIVAILVMGTLAYPVLRWLPTTSESAPVWSAVVAVAVGAIGSYILQPSESERLARNLREWVAVFLGSWLLSVVFFLAACWLRVVPLSEALTFPPALWKDTDNYLDRLFWWAMLLGPGATLLAIGFLARLSVLRLWGAFLTRA